MTIPPELRAHVVARAFGRCEYCLLHEEDAGFVHEVDHIVSRKHGGETTEADLAYACFTCNRFKGSDLGSIGAAGLLIRFFDPRRQRWADRFLIRGPVLEPLSVQAEVTAKVLRLNSARRVRERQGCGVCAAIHECSK